MTWVGEAAGYRILEGEVAVVTGANRGIGKAIAEALARAGAAVAVVGRTASSAVRVADDIRREGGSAVGLQGDVTGEGSVADLQRRVVGELGPPSIVVANAGVAGPTLPLHQLSLDQWRECVAVNLDGVFVTFRAFLPSMIERRGGSLIAISSATGKKPLRDRAPYAAAKTGVIGLVRTLAVEVGPYGVRVNALCPGPVEGERIDEVIRTEAATRGLSEDEVRRQKAEGAALRRFSGAMEIASACVFLASPLASAVTGEDLNVSAGFVMY